MILTIIQARLSSTRLPGKAMLPICGKPMLQHVIEAAPGEKVVAVPYGDDLLWDLCQSLDVTCIGGNEDDVLARYMRVLKFVPFEPEWILRLTADCPMLTRELTQRFLRLCAPKRYPHAIHTNRPLDYDGLDMELFPTWALAKAHEVCRDPYEREHVTPWMYTNLDVRRVSITGNRHGHPDTSIKLSVDTQAEYERVKRLMEETP